MTLATENPSGQAVGKVLEDFRRGVVGVYPGIPAAEYHRLGAISSSALKRVHTHSPRHAKAVMDNPDLISGESIDIGGGAHALILTPDDFERDYVCARQCEQKIKTGDNAGRQCKNSGVLSFDGQWLCGVHGKGLACDYSSQGKRVLTTDEYRRVKGIHDSVWANDKAREIMQAATDFELSVLWTDEATGLLNKARFDILCRSINVLPDLKSCRTAKPAFFQAHAFDAAYHIQLAHYQRSAIISGIPADIMPVIAVENEEPFDVIVFEPTRRFMDAGFRDMDAAMAKVKQCHKSGVWPGYAKGTQMLDLPERAK